MNVDSVKLVASPISINLKSFILLWAFAETSIGGVLHALKLPFTGIFVGGIAVICIAMLGYYQKAGERRILEALFIVLMVKLLVSPHSPWQAYIAVTFQGYLGSLIYRNNQNFKLKTLIFAMIALFESAIQKLLVTMLIFGVHFFESLDSAATSVVSAFGLDAGFSFVYTAFGIYISLHLLVGLILGMWIPKIPGQVIDFAPKIAYIEQAKPIDKLKLAKYKRSVWASIVVFILILACMKWLLPETKYSMLIWMFFRALLISLLLVFIVSPLIKKWVKKWVASKNIDASSWNDIIDMIPQFTLKVIGVMKFVNQNFKGFNKVKYFLIGIITLSVNELD